MLHLSSFLIAYLQFFNVPGDFICKNNVNVLELRHHVSLQKINLRNNEKHY